MPALMLRSRFDVVAAGCYPILPSVDCTTNSRIVPWDQSATVRAAGMYLYASCAFARATSRVTGARKTCVASVPSNISTVSLVIGVIVVNSARGCFSCGSRDFDAALRADYLRARSASAARSRYSRWSNQRARTLMRRHSNSASAMTLASWVAPRLTWRLA